MKRNVLKSRRNRRGRISAIATLLFGSTLLFAAATSRAGSIFDDDYVPPKRAEPAPEQPAPTPAPVSPTVPPSPAPPVNPPPDAPAPAPAIPAHHPIPDKTSLTKSGKLFEEAFATDLKDHSPAARRKLAQKLLDEVGKTAEGSADRYMLLIGTMQAAEEGQNLRMAFAAARLLTGEFSGDELAFKAQAVTKTFAGTPTPTVAGVANVEQALAVADQLVAEDAFVTVGPVESALQHVAGSIPDAELKRDAFEQIREAAAIREAHDQVAPAMARLKQSLSDQSANLAVGKYLCFQRGNWDQGLPFLAKSSDAQLKTLAANELAALASGGTVINAGDAWFESASKFSEADRGPAMRHAGALYRRPATNLTGLQNLAIEKRLAQIPPPPRFRHVDLLDTFDPATSVVAGSWRMEEGAMFGEAANCGHIQFAYEPPAEYDFRVTFTPLHMAEGIVQICSCSEHQFLFVIAGSGDSVCGFDLINGASFSDNKTTKRKNHWLTEGRRYTSVVKVRKTSVEAYIDGQLIASLKTDYSDLSLRGDWRLSQGNLLGFGTNGTPIILDSAEVFEISGEGKRLPAK